MKSYCRFHTILIALTFAALPAHLVAQLLLADEINITTQSGTYVMTMEAQGDVFDSSSTGYPFTSAYDYYSTGSPEASWVFNFVEDAAGGVSEGDIGYGLYKLTLQDGGAQVVYLDFRDCDYENGDGSYGTDYDHPDMEIKYFPGSKSFKTRDQDTGEWSWMENDTTHVWDDSRKNPATSGGTSCFGAPAVPSGFDVELVQVGSWLKPKLTWTANSEYDLDGHDLWRKINSGDWSVLATLSAGATSYIDQSVFIGGCGNHDYAFYKIKAFDWGPLYSAFSGQRLVRHGGSIECGGPVPKAVAGEFRFLAPQDYALHNNYPNPFNPTTTITYALPEASQVQLTVYDLAGRTVATLADGTVEAGYGSAFWSGKDDSGRPVPTGIYLYRLTVDGLESGERFTQTRKMLLLK